MNKNEIERKNWHVPSYIFNYQELQEKPKRIVMTEEGFQELIKNIAYDIIDQHRKDCGYPEHVDIASDEFSPKSLAKSFYNDTAHPWHSDIIEYLQYYFKGDELDILEEEFTAAIISRLGVFNYSTD